MSIGYDCGTYNLVSCRRGKNNEFVYTREVNAFIEFPLKDRFIFNLMKSHKDENGDPAIPLIEWETGGVAYALGEAAIKFAYSFPTVELKRPMISGCLNPKEKHAQQIMSLLIHNMLGSAKDKETLYYSIPANAINEETDADYHSLVLKDMFGAFQDDEGHKINANPINEGLALVYAELASKGFTGIGISFGGGMINLCFAVFGAPVFQFSIVNSGDWIDKQAAKASGESIAVVNREKPSVDLLKPGESIIHKAIAAQYSIMIQKTVGEIKKGLEMSGHKARADQPIDIVIAGGTSAAKGFDSLFTEAVKNANLPIQIGQIIRPVEPLLSVARGCLIAAEAADQG